MIFVSWIIPHCCNLSPRGDGNIHRPRPSILMPRCNLSPRGDGNAGKQPLRVEYAVAIYPREGTETSADHRRRTSRKLQFIPARGRKPQVSSRVPICIHVAIYPREGTETVSGIFRAQTRRCNLSPRGDGNRISGIRTPYVTVAIYPREGTETRRICLPSTAVKLQFIPARGRKHESRDRDALDSGGCNLSPRGDGNPRLPASPSRSRRLQFIPARGRKREQDVARVAHLGCNLSPRGDGNDTLSALPRASRGCNLSPRGDGNVTPGLQSHT